MTREDIEAFVQRGTPVTIEEAREVIDHEVVDHVDVTVTGDGSGRVYLDAVHFKSNSAPAEQPRSYPDGITNPVDPPTADGTSIMWDLR